MHSLKSVLFGKKGAGIEPFSWLLLYWDSLGAIVLNECAFFGCI